MDVISKGEDSPVGTPTSTNSKKREQLISSTSGKKRDEIGGIERKESLNTKIANSILELKTFNDLDIHQERKGKPVI